MKRLVRWILNHIPRSLLQRMASWSVPLLGLLYIGRGRECPVCGVRRRRFLPYGYVTSREDALCPRCLALERHRLLWLWIERETDLTTARPRLLHIAPEVSLMRRFKRVYAGTGDYLTADLCSPLAQMHFDVQQIPLADESVDAVICNHLLEHVDDDRQAMRELHRIMRRGGWGIMLSPVDESREKTFEDPAVTDPKERTRLFGQYDHRRVYGRDYADRLREAGFEVQTLHYARRFSDDDRRRYALRDEPLYIVRRPASNGADTV